MLIDGDRLVEVSIVARRLGVSSDTVRRALADPGNPLRGVRLHRGCVRVWESSVADLIAVRELAAHDRS